MVRILAISGAMAALAGSALAEPPAEAENLFSLRPAIEGPVAAVTTSYDAPGTSVRVTIYDSKEHFLEEPHAKREATLDENGVALVSLKDLEPGEYALAAYLDVNGDGKLNRGSLLGRPKEPVAFSNGFKPKLRKPRFDETKVSLSSDSVVVITLGD